MKTLLKFLVFGLASLAAFGADPQPYEVAYRSMWPYAEGTQEIKFKEVCRRKGRADTTQVCELIPYKQQNLGKLLSLNQANPAGKYCRDGSRSGSKSSSECFAEKR